MPTKKIKNNTISLSEISDKVWCEIVCNESNCVLTLFPQNIPEDYRGKKNTDTVKCTVSCPTTTEAQRCQEALASLISNGYNEPLNWYIALDIEDLMKIFSDEISFCGDDDGPCNGYAPVLRTNMFDMHGENNYFLYIDDLFGQDENTSEFYIDLIHAEEFCNE